MPLSKKQQQLQNELMAQPKTENRIFFSIGFFCIFVGKCFFAYLPLVVYVVFNYRELKTNSLFLSLSFVFIAQINSIFNIVCEPALSSSVKKEKIFLLFAIKILCAICCLAFSTYQVNQFHLLDYALCGKDIELLWIFRWVFLFIIVSLITLGYSTYFDRIREARISNITLNNAVEIIRRSPSIGKKTM